MTTTLSSPACFDALGLPVELEQIDKKLQELFGSMATEDSSGAVRASLINFALYSEDQTHTEEDIALLEAVTNEAACRSLLISSDTKADINGAKAWLQVHCLMDKSGKKSVCTEQISFHLSGNAPGMLPNVIFSHLDSDLPLAFWWRGEFSDAFEEKLYSRIDRLIFDSEVWALPRNQFVRLEGCQKTVRRPFRMHDLAFSRINGVRHAVCNAFDQPVLKSQSRYLDHFTIRYGEGRRMSAVYLAAWLANRLEAELDLNHSSSSALSFSSRLRVAPPSFQIHLEKTDSDGMTVDLEAAFCDQDITLHISRLHDRDVLETKITKSGELASEEWLPETKDADAPIVIDVLNRAGRNRAHLEALPIVNQILTLS